MEVRTRVCYTTKKLKSGEVRQYLTAHKYEAKASHIRITDEMRATILHDHSLGIPATRIAQNLGITVERIRRAIKKAE